MYASGVDSNSRYFFGAYDVNWAEICLKMFDRMLDRIAFDNKFHPEYLSLQQAEMLRHVRCMLNLCCTPKFAEFANTRQGTVVRGIMQ